MSPSFVPDPLQSAQINEMRRTQDLFELDSRFQRPKVPDRFWIIKIHVSVETNKLQWVLPRLESVFNPITSSYPSSH